MKKIRFIYLLLSILWPLISFYIIVILYNLWFDTWDKIKYDPTYSPEFDQDKTTENIVYWSVVIVCIILVIVFIRRYRKAKIK